MKLEIRVGVDFGKLASDMSKLIDSFISDSLIGTSIKLTKDNIKSGGVTPPLLQSTIDRRKRGKTGTRHGGNRPLYDSGDLHDSLKKSKNGIDMVKYAPIHHEGIPARMSARPFLIIPKLDTIQKTLIESMKTSLHRKSPLVLKT